MQQDYLKRLFLVILSLVLSSRLGCQVKITEDLEGMDVLLDMTINRIGDNSWNNTKLLCGWSCSKTSLVCLKNNSTLTNWHSSLPCFL